jgi:hypothetical protein
METNPSSAALQQQRQRNAALQDAWERFAPHRERVMELLMQAAVQRDSPRLALLGVGNGNDVDLKQLLTKYAPIHLTDLDAMAIERGLARQGLSMHPALEVLGGVDLFDARMDGGGVDVACSLCVLSQLIEQAASSWEASDIAEQLVAVKAARLRHLQLLTRLLAPGGVAILVTDFVSSDTLPELSKVSSATLPQLLARALREQNFFTGLNPAVMLDQLRSETALKDQVTHVQASAPWTWNLGPRTYGVYAVTWQRRGSIEH